MPITGVVSARHKLARAEIHINNLAAQIDEFVNSNRLNVKLFWEPSRTHIGEVDIEVVIDGIAPAEVPDDWGLVAGDALTNMRAALDHSVFPHSRQFPILKTFHDRRGRPQTFDIFSPAVTALIDSYQPRASDSPDLDPLGVLNELVNEDKHRQLLVANSFNAGLLVAKTEEYEITHEEVYDFEKLTQGDIISRLRVKSPQRATEMEFVYRQYLYTEPVINIPHTSEHIVIVDGLRRVHERVSEVVEALAKAGIP
ncbi:hypothetical protein ACWIGI_28845 [Nocardia sp. NPDC055321]